ncbi:EF-hand calcium-binding domain-containing protein 4B isoform 2-T4 [Spinachia spinachia]
MAAFTPPRAATTTTATVARTAWRMKGGGKAGGNEVGKCENREVGQNAIAEKTREFFQMCDIENKGFVTQRDMQRLNAELPLSAEELENVFVTLDSDGNGYLTLNEFSSGFSEFLFGRKISFAEGTEETDGRKSPAEVLYQSQWEESVARGGEDEEEKHFSMLMESLGANSVFEDPAEVRSLWAQLSRDEPELLSNFEDFLARVTSQIREANQEKNEMESALQRKAATHDDQIQHLYEEMEQQIKTEKDRIVLQDYERFLSLSQDLEQQLSCKERELEQLFQKQKRLEVECRELQSDQHVTQVENVKLKHKNDELAQELDQTSQELMVAQEQLNLLQEQSTQLHEDKEIEIYRLTEGLQRERAGLLKQLDLLREMNKHLRDEKDICFQNTSNSKKTLKHGRSSINVMRHTKSSVFGSEEDEELPISSVRHNLTSLASVTAKTGGHLQRIISIEEDHLPHLLQNYCQPPTPLRECREEEAGSDTEESMDLVMSDIYTSTPSSPRGQPVGKETSINEEGGPAPPDRLFKIVLVGNSSVGKTSLLRRFCDDCFHAGTSATVGIDYSVKTLAVDSSQVALQLWDTAGQERYRSITKQFFRKADGVVVIYDITAVHSFTAVRQWLTSVKARPRVLCTNTTSRTHPCFCAGFSLQQVGRSPSGGVVNVL